MIAARQIAFGKGADVIAYTAKDYVQDGLIHQYDGIENVGYGEHSNDAIVWVDLVGGNDAPLRLANVIVTDISDLEGKGQWLSDSFVMNKSIDRYSGFCSSSTISIPQEFTMTGIIQTDFTYSYVAGNMMGVCATYEGVGVVVCYPISQTERLGCRFGEVIDFRENLPLTPKEQTLVYKNRLLTIYVDGELVTEVSYANDPSDMARVENIRPIWHAYYSYSNSYRGLKFMVYNRALTAEEVAHNYEIDKARFDL